MARLSKRTVDTSRPLGDGRRYIVWDESLRGFGLLVLPTGAKSFIYNYRNPRGTKRRATIGKVGALTPDQARRIADDMATLVKNGGDPLAAKASAREALTVGDIFDRYLKSEKFAEKADSTRPIDQGRIKRHLRPLLGSKFVDDLTDEEIKRARVAIRDGKTAVDVKTGPGGRARVTGGPTAARDSIGLLRAILNWAITQKLMTGSNPAANIELGSNGKRDTILDGPDDYARLFQTLVTMENEKRIRAPVADAIRILALTGARRGEITNLRWKYVDLKAGVITIPPAAHKTGRATGESRVISLPAVAQEIIARQTKREADDFVFAPAKGSGPLNINKPWRDVRTEAGLPDGIGLHGLRHSMASMLAMSGAQASELQAALGHSDVKMASRYVHWASNARAALAERAAAPALAGMAAAADKPTADVVEIKRRRP